MVNLTNGVISTIAGSGGTASGGFYGDGGPAIAARLNTPSGIAFDSFGNLYIADTGNNRIRRINSTDGIIGSTIAGTGGSSHSGDGGPAIQARFQPFSIVVGSNGNVLFSVPNNHRIRMINSTDGTISTIAGIGTKGFSGDDGPATSAELDNPRGLALDSHGNLYIADSGNRRVRRVSYLDKTISTIAGDGSTTHFKGPYSLHIDSKGNIYVGDDGYTIRMINSTDGSLSTISGSGGSFPRFSGDGGPAILSGMGRPNSIVDFNGDIYIADSNGVIRMINNNGIITTLAGINGFSGFAGDERKVVSPHEIVSVSHPSGITKDLNGNILFSETNGEVVRMINSSNGIISTIAGTRYKPGFIDNVLATNARLSSPGQVSVGPNGFIYIADTGNHLIRMINSNGIMSIRAGVPGQMGFNMDNTSPYSATLFSPEGVFVLPDNNILIADTRNNRIRRITSTGIIFTIAGNGEQGFYGENLDARFSILNNPTSVFVSGNGNIYIADMFNNRIRMITSIIHGVIRTIAGNGVHGFSGDGGLAINAQLRSPRFVSADSKGNVYISDTGNSRIRMVNTSGFISTIAGNEATGYSGDGIATQVQLRSPRGHYVDERGGIYFTDNLNNLIRKLEPRLCSGIDYTNTSVCSGNGQCIGTDTCSCNQDWFGENCEITKCFDIFSNNLSVCNNNGQCNEPNSCSCNQDWFGDSCNFRKCFNILSNNQSVCSGNGQCIGLDTCSCNQDWIGDNCEVTECYNIFSNDTSVCSGNGQCIGLDSCSCNQDWYGDNCELTKCNKIYSNDSLVCSGNGQCIGPNSCNCKQDWFGDNCELRKCFGIYSNDSSVCNNNGQCNEPNSCSCNQDWFGNSCDVTKCNKIYSNDSSACSGNGQCIGPNSCNCKQDWFGNRCELRKCFDIFSNDTSVCSGNGQCDGSNYCSCSSDWFGDDCSLRRCNNLYSNDTSVCSGNGVCIGLDTCSCNQDWFGENCNFRKCFNILSNDQSVCSGNGQCIGPNSCNCKQDWFGSECELRKCFGLYSNDTSVCSGNGQCNGPNLCSCNQDWIGQNCKVTNCYDLLSNDTSVCFGNGECILLYTKKIRIKNHSVKFSRMILPCEKYSLSDVLFRLGKKRSPTTTTYRIKNW